MNPIFNQAPNLRVWQLNRGAYETQRIQTESYVHLVLYLGYLQV